MPCVHFGRSPYRKYAFHSNISACHVPKQQSMGCKPCRGCGLGSRAEQGVERVGGGTRRLDGRRHAGSGDSGQYPDPEPFLRPVFHSRGPDNDIAYKNPEVDRLLDAARIERNAEKRRTYYQQAEKLIIEDAPCVAFYHRTAAILLRPRWRNIPMGYLQVCLEIERAELPEER